VQYACLPWRRQDGGLQVMLITSRGTGRWVLPKGWPMIGVSGVESAVQEALEEAGVVGEAGAAIGRYSYDKALKDGSVRTLEVEVYPLAVSDELADWKESAERVRRWFTPAEAAGLVAEYELAELIAAFPAHP
jgi:8-oxo-dGTP pyrophosphatase MutT (NUDIX family)